MVVGIVDQPDRHPRPARASRALGRTAVGRSQTVTVAVRGVDGRASRCCSGSSARKPGSQSLHDAGVRRRGCVLAGVVAGSVLTVAYTRPLRVGHVRSAAHAGTRRRRRRAGAAQTGRRRSLVAGRRARRGRDLVLGVAPCARRPARSARPRGVAARRAHVARTSRSGTASNLPLLLSALAHRRRRGAVRRSRRPVGRCSARGARRPERARTSTRSCCAARTVWRPRSTGVVQNGSLPIYAGVTLLTAAVRARRRAARLARRGRAGPRLADEPGADPDRGRRAARRRARAPQSVRRRFSAALFLGTVGYAMAGLFVVQGAPDLALTQVAIETLSTVLFVLVLRRLPDRFERTSTSRRRVAPAGHLGRRRRHRVRLRDRRRAALATAEPVSTEMIERVAARRATAATSST